MELPPLPELLLLLPPVQEMNHSRQTFRLPWPQPVKQILFSFSCLSSFCCNKILQAFLLLIIDNKFLI